MYITPRPSDDAKTTRPDAVCYGCPHYDEEYCWYVPCDKLISNP